MSGGVVAAGHALTAAAAEDVLRAGGNAYDALIAALATSFVAEPVLSSPGGGGFLLAAPAGERPRVYDFFVQTPRGRRPAGEVEFHPVMADFGAAQQEFHIGRGTAATPGMMRGLAEIHADLATVPLRELVAPACRLAIEGVTVSEYQAYLFGVTEAIFGASEACRSIFGSAGTPGKLVQAGERLANPMLADALEAIAIEGADLFYRGEIAASLVSDMAADGHLAAADLAGYRVEKRAPLSIDYRGVRILTNPPPSSGGTLVGFGLDLLGAEDAGAGPFDAGRSGDGASGSPAQAGRSGDGASGSATQAGRSGDGASGSPAQAGRFDSDAFGSPAHVGHLAAVMEATAAARVEHSIEALASLDPVSVARWREQVAGRARAFRGTTQVSVIDAAGNVASATVSNGAGSDYVVPGTGIVMNNMLGEADLNPGGFHRWPLDERMTSMMAPTALAWRDGRKVATGSGGSSRIRTALLQVLVNLVDFAMDVEEAVAAPRIHVEDSFLSVEGGFDPERIAPVLEAWPDHQLWDAPNMFFGGAHTVASGPRGVEGAGDPRRGGACVIVA